MHILKAGFTTVTATVADGMNFEYATNTATCEVTVNKAAGFVTLSATSGDVVEDGGTTTFTVATNHGGALTVSTSDATKATATISGTTVTVTGAAQGTATITVTCAATDNYEAATATYTATVKSADPGLPLSQAQNGYKVGDNGKAYPPSEAYPDGVSTIGVVAGKNGSNGYVVKSTNLGTNWSWNQIAESSDNPKNLGSAGEFYVSDLSSKTEKNWICGTKAQYQACGAGDGGYLPLSAYMVAAGVDGTALEDRYWSCSGYSASAGWAVTFMSWDTFSKSADSGFHVRPLFAF